MILLARCVCCGAIGSLVSESSVPGFVLGAWILLGCG
jgi:hypothetical protein